MRECVLRAWFVVREIETKIKKRNGGKGEGKKKTILIVNN